MEGSYLLALETSTEVCSVCISRGSEIIAHRTAEEPMVHTRKTTLLIQDIIKEASIQYQDLNAIVLSEGPGSYTGLRVGGSLAKGFCYGLEIPLIVVNTLESMAYYNISMSTVRGKNLYVPMIDARRMEVYLSMYDGNYTQIESNRPFILEADSFEKYLEDYDHVIFSGNGVPKYRDIVDNKRMVFTDIVCDAQYLISIGAKKYQTQDFVDVAYFSPNYIKPPNITKSKKKIF